MPTRDWKHRKLWEDEWFNSLPPLAKLVVEYLRAYCDEGGIWEFDQTSIEGRIGIRHLPAVWTHPNLPGIQYLAIGSATDDVEERDLDPKKLSIKPPIRWNQMVAMINKPPPDEVNPHFERLQVVGGNKWWFIQTLFDKFGKYDADGKPVLNLLTIGSSRSKLAIKVLNEHGLIPRLEKIFPDLKLPMAGGTSAFDRPTMDDVTSDPAGAALPRTVKRVFFLQHEQTDWKDCHDWRSELKRMAERHVERAAWTEISGLPWPETKAEREENLKLISDKMEEVSRNRIDVGGELKLSSESKETLKILKRAEELINSEKNY